MIEIDITLIYQILVICLLSSILGVKIYSLRKVHQGDRNMMVPPFNISDPIQHPMTLPQPPVMPTTAIRTPVIPTPYSSSYGKN